MPLSLLPAPPALQAPRPVPEASRAFDFFEALP